MINIRSSMDRPGGRHLIGEPVEMILPRKKRGILFPNAPYGPKMDGFFRDRLRAMAIAMGIAFVIAIVLTAPLLIFIIFLLPLLIIFMAFLFLLIIGISYPMMKVLMRSRIKDMERNGVTLHENGIRVRSKYSIGSPTVDIDIPYSNIEGASIGGKAFWESLERNTPKFFMFLNGFPQPRAEDLFTMFSKTEDLIVVRLKKPVRIDRLVPSSGFRTPRQRSYRVRELVLDIDPGRQGEFLDLLSALTSGPGSDL